MPPTSSTTLFPDGYYPDADNGGYTNSNRAGRLVTAAGDDGSEQVAETRSFDLSDIVWNSLPLDSADDSVFYVFAKTCGSGFTPFTFWDPFTQFYGFGATGLQVATFDGTAGPYTLPFRNVNSYSQITVNGTPDAASIANEAISPTKEDTLTLGSTAYTVGDPINIWNFWARRRFICRMDEWRRGPYKGGNLPAVEFDPLVTSVPYIPSFYTFTFHEVP